MDRYRLGHNCNRAFVCIKIKGSEIIYIFGSLLSEIERLSKSLEYKFNHDLIDNVLIFGLKNQTKQIMENKKCKNTTKS